MALKRVSSHKAIGEEYQTNIVPTRSHGRVTQSVARIPGNSSGEVNVSSSFRSSLISQKVEELKKIRDQEKERRDLRTMLKDRQDKIENML